MEQIAENLNENEEAKSETEDSDDGLKIVIDSPQNKRKGKLSELEISPNDKQIIETVANDLEKTLEEKAAKANLTALNVKNIIKHVVTNEHVLAMVRHAEDPYSEKESLPIYEPKLTRAKAKELFPTQTVTNIPWMTPTKLPSEVQVLISEELQEDSSGDEYIPAEEESEDDKDSSIHSESDLNLVDLPTPKNTDSATQTNWSEDGVFKVPHAKTKEAIAEEANIARRTRSKLSLSSTPLEVIEEAFIPPDITTDMYDMDCDDDDWRDFLKTFTRPLEEVVKDDEDHDPEYNVLADEEIDKVDKEELRADKAVKVTRKELNELMAELFEYADNFTRQHQNQSLVNIEPQPQFTILANGTVEESHKDCAVPEEQNQVIEVKIDDVMITDTQKLLLEQQMRQHVQILTQHFILAYEHPEHYEVAEKCKEYLLNLKCLSANKTSSYFSTINLYPALELIDFWESKFLTNDIEAQNSKAHVAKVYHECREAMNTGNQYIPTFPRLVLDTISKSSVFLYVSLLPKIPYKPTVNSAISKAITKSENELIALGLEQFIPFLQEDPHHIGKNGKVRMKHVCYYIHRYMMPTKDYNKIHKYISVCKNSRSEPTPIQYYFQNSKAPITFHYVIDVQQLGVLPPNQRKPEELPLQWKQYVYGNISQQVLPSFIIPIVSNNTNQVIKAPVYKNFVAKRRRILPKPSNNVKSICHISCTAKRRIKFDYEPCRSANESRISNNATSTPIGKPKKLEQYFRCNKVSYNSSNLSNLKFNSTIFKNLKFKNTHKKDKMLPSMPSLTTPYKKSPERSVTPPKEEMVSLPMKIEEKIDENVSNAKDNIEEIPDQYKIEMNDEISGKDNIDDINALMVASSTVKPIRKKTLSGVEKKRAKLKKDMNAALSILVQEDESQSEEKANRYVQAYYDKLQERLDIHEYHKLIEILNNFEANRDSVPDLYKSVNEILSPKYSDLTDEFLPFLTAAQAKAVGKFVPHIMLNNMSLFLRKLEMYFKGQPFQVKKIYRSFTELVDCVDITMDRVKSTILPLLKGNKLLIDWFLQIFPCEKPTQSLLNGIWENIEVGKDNSFNTKDDVYETIVVPEVEDPYGGPNCICSCHNVEDQAFKNRSRHCIPCGTKFLQGRVYVHTGKGLRLAKVTFNSSNYSNIDHYKRLGCVTSMHQYKRRSEVSPSKHLVSPSKDNQDDARMSNESEDDDYAKKKQQKLSKIPRKRRPKTKKEKKALDQKMVSIEKPQLVKSEIDLADNDIKEETLDTVDQAQENVSDSSLNEQKPIQETIEGEEVMEWDCNTSIESIELKHSPEPSAESESGETSQDNINTDSDCSTENVPSPTHLHSENSNSNTGEESSWTREEDKIILETFRREGDNDATFQLISDMLENRSVSKVKSRFQTLLNILQEMATKKVL